MIDRGQLDTGFAADGTRWISILRAICGMRHWRARQPGIAIARIEGNFFTDPGRKREFLIGIRKLDFSQTEPLICTFELID